MNIEKLAKELRKEAEKEAAILRRQVAHLGLYTKAYTPLLKKKSEYNELINRCVVAEKEYLDVDHEFHQIILEIKNLRLNGGSRIDLVILLEKGAKLGDSRKEAMESLGAAEDDLKKMSKEINRYVLSREALSVSIEDDQKELEGLKDES